MKEINKLEKSLVVQNSDGVFTKIIKWIKGLFVKTPNNEYYYENNNIPKENNIEYTIPKAVKLPVREIENDDIEEPLENSLEYLYKLSDNELDDLSLDYDKQMENAKTEFLKLDNILQTYKQSIKKLQGRVDTEENY